MPDFIDIVPKVKSILPLPSIIQALHQFKVDITTMEIAAVDYECLQVSTVKLSPSMPPWGHVDGCALASTTNCKQHLWAYDECNDEEHSKTTRLQVADNTIHVPTGIRCLKVPYTNAGEHKFVKTCCTPGILVTILSPDAMGKELYFQGYQTYSDFQCGHATLDLTNCKLQLDPVHFELKLMHSLLFTECVIAPTELEHTAPHPCNDTFSHDVLSTTPCHALCASTQSVKALTHDHQPALCHMCLGHMNKRLVSDLHKCVDDVLSLPCSNILHLCPMCAQAKLHKANHGNTDITEATDCWQDI